MDQHAGFLPSLVSLVLPVFIARVILIILIMLVALVFLVVPVVSVQVFESPFCPSRSAEAQELEHIFVSSAVLNSRLAALKSSSTVFATSYGRYVVR
jgi:hypothetical protein